MVSRSWDAFAAAAALRHFFCSLALACACQASGSQSLQMSQGESSVHKVSPSLSRHCWQRKWLSLCLRKWVHPGNFRWDSAEDDRSRDLESVILSTQVRLDTETKINLTSDHKRLNQNVHTWDRLTSFTAATNYLLFMLENHLGRPLGQCAIGLISAHERGKNRSERQVDMVLCAGATARGAERGLHFIVWNFAWDRLASRLHAATATMFLMQTNFRIICLFTAHAVDSEWTRCQCNDGRTNYLRLSHLTALPAVVNNHLRCIHKGLKDCSRVTPPIQMMIKQF